MKNGHAHHYHLNESTFIFREGQWGGNMGPHPLGPKEIEGLFVPPGNAYMLLTGDLIITG